jgi:hypothetical protein
MRQSLTLSQPWRLTTLLVAVELNSRDKRRDLGREGSGGNTFIRTPA